MDTDPGPAFADPWEARAFALVKGLLESGQLTAREWTDALAREIQRAGDGAAEDAAAYSRHWLAALEHVVIDQHLVSADVLVARGAAWRRAAARTPHGQPVELADGDVTPTGPPGGAGSTRAEPPLL